MTRFLAFAMLVFVVGCGGQADSSSLWRIDEPGNPNFHVSKTKPVVSGNTVTFQNWIDGKTTTISGNFQVSEAAVVTCPNCKKTILEGSVQCVFCNTPFPKGLKK